jgi:hypothetical protein
MRKEVEQALQNIDSVIASVQLNRNQHAELARNIRLIHDELAEATMNKEACKIEKPKKV